METAPDDAVGLLLDNLKEFIKYNEDLFGDYTNEIIHKLLNDLGLLKGNLRNYREVYILHNDLTKSAMSIALDARDAIEKCLVNLFKWKHGGTVHKMLALTNQVRELRNLAKKMESISVRVHDLINRRPALELMANTSTDKTPRKLIYDYDMVVGLEDETEKVIKLLIEGPEELEVISIVGMLGLGKTTLARKVFKHPEVEYSFYIRGFVEVSHRYKRKEVFIKILRFFTSVTQQVERMSVEDLAKLIKQHLERRKYLIVLDSVWTIEAWVDLRSVFPNNKNYSRVLITTQNKAVAEYVKQMCDPHFLSFLNLHESQKLLRRKVFGEDSCPRELEEVEALILERFEGLPLAIVTVAGILTNRRNDTRWWNRVMVGMENGNSEFNKQINCVIELSFNNLPYILRQCFLYLGVFPENFEIPVRTLIQLWVSEGFVLPPKWDGTMEDVAEDYLEELIDRSLVAVVRTRSNGQVKTIRIHNSLHKFCKDYALKEDLFREMKGFERAVGSTYSNKDRRLCINSNVSEYMCDRLSGKHIRSFLSFTKDNCVLPVEHISSIFRAFKQLGVLDIRSIKLTQFPSLLNYMVLLKYLAVSCEFEILPEEMSNLCNLQTLIVKTSSHILEIKADIWKMTQLRHIDTDASTSLTYTLESPINANLQTLCRISPKSFKGEVFRRTPMLKKLGVQGNLSLLLEDSETSFYHISNLEVLENLKLLNDKRSGKLHVIPTGIKYLRKLTSLTLLNTLLDWEQMLTLGELENLEVLKLKEKAFWGESWNTVGVFRRLRVLYIISTNLTVWNASESAFPRLTHLYLRYCTELEGIPLIYSLQMIDLHCTNQPLVSAMKFRLAEKNKDSGFKLIVYPADHLIA